MKPTRLLGLFVLTLALAACQQGVKPSPPPAASAADDNLNAVLWLQQSAEYAATTTGLYRAATAALDTALATHEDALLPGERPSAVGKKPPAIIMDIDETVLDNSPYQARLIAAGAEFDEGSWDAWVAEGKARAIPGAVAFTRAAAARGITVFYVSNRSAALKAETLANLRAAGLAVRDDGVFLGMGHETPGCEQAKPSEKICRRQQIARDYRVLMQFGDQLGDFARIAQNSAEARAAFAREYADWWGQRWWMLPNPTYGSWEPALFGNDWAKPRETRRQLKHNALDYSK